MALVSLGKIIWAMGVVAWYLIRRPAERRARRHRIVSNQRSTRDKVGLVSASVGLGLIPGLFALTGFPHEATYSARPISLLLGAVLYAAAMWIFRRTHKELGKNWSISLEIREEHELIASGPYALVRHPMYTSFLLMAGGQAFLLANWIVGLAGFAGFAVLFFLRVDKEEQMMLEFFGSRYREYMRRTKRIIPYVY
ncbi:protein-S-isoprenylcysteine O-methyltransferase [Rhizobium sp. Root708]|uniref:protein-S-isoprenylcysteine O-methyltransferase n=1 Tax=Rhizobium sp. Root708 TaxID=1736592 RepID=UPI000AABAD9F|nr:protein-S-isoprenylcysteine O-methyltransferase [Rhizobium sp. Root708]